MKRTLSSLVLVALATFVLSGCAVPVVMAANLAAMAVGGKAVAENRANKCFDIETKAKADGLSGAETRRNLTAAGCSTSGIQ